MAEVPQTKIYEYDVFLIYASGDENEKFAKKICGELEKHSLNCVAQFKTNAFRPGTHIFDNAVKYVSCSDKTLLILTDESMKSYWVTFETILALEESQRSHSLRLRVLLYNVDENERFLRNGLLESVPRVKLDKSKAEWGKELAKEIRQDVPMTDILPFGSMAHGLVFSHYTGFLRYVLPVLKEKIKGSKIYKTKPNAVSFKYFMLLPGSGKIRNDLTSESDGMKIEIEEKLEFEKFHAGKPRKITISLYKISKGSEEYYFFADFPNVLNSMHKIDGEKIARIDMKFQIARFLFTMNEMVNHAENVKCHNTVQLLPFNEHKESMQMALWNAVSESVPTEHVTARMENMHIKTPKQPVEKLNEKQSDEPKLFDATISCYEESEEDRRIAGAIKDYLEGKGKSVVPGSKIGQSRLRINKAKWHIFILSKEAIEKPNELPTVCMSAMADDLHDNVLSVLVVIRDIEPRQVPRFIKCINMLKTEENFCEQLLQTMDGGILRLEHAMPCGDVATGLAWAYVINYLQVTLLGASSEETAKLDFQGRIRSCLKEKNRPEGCILKLFIVLPKSCKTGDLAVKVNEGFTDSPVTYVGELLPVILNTGGQIGRHFKHHMYLMEDPETSKKTCFLAEYCTPAYCMREMVEQYKFAGLQEDEMERQCIEFANLLPQIWKQEGVIKKLGDISQLVELVFYNEKEETLFKAIKRHVLADGLPVVFADK